MLSIDLGFWRLADGVPTRSVSALMPPLARLQQLANAWLNNLPHEPPPRKLAEGHRMPGTAVEDLLFHDQVGCGALKHA
jgi:hypothetical protein